MGHEFFLIEKLVLVFGWLHVVQLVNVPAGGAGGTVW